MQRHAGIHNSDVIDMVLYNPEIDSFILVMAQTRPWDSGEVSRKQLIEKVNGYLDFAMGGQLHTMYPQSVGKPLQIQLRYFETPDAAVEDLLKWLSVELVKKYNVALDVRPLDGHSSGDLYFLDENCSG